MTWDEIDPATIVTGAIGLGVGLVIAGKIIKDISSIKLKDCGSDCKIEDRWRL